MTRTGPAAASGDVSALQLARWDQGSSRLFGPLLMDPDGYQGVVAVLAVLMDRLRSATPDLVSLVGCADSVPEWAAQSLAQTGSGQHGALPVDPTLLAHAALAQRYRELKPLEDARHRLVLLAGAGETGAWVVLEESGDAAGDPYLPYRRLEADPSTGRAVLVRSDPDEDFTCSEHTVVAAVVDLQTGELRLAGENEPTTLPDVAARERAVEELRAASDPD